MAGRAGTGTRGLAKGWLDASRSFLPSAVVLPSVLSLALRCPPLPPPLRSLSLTTAASSDRSDVTQPGVAYIQGRRLCMPV